MLTEGGGIKGGVRSGVSGGGAPGGNRGTGDPLVGGTPCPATRRSERACASAAFIAEELSWAVRSSSCTFTTPPTLASSLLTFASNLS